MINFKGRIVTFAWNKMLIWKSLSFQGLWRHMGPILVHLLALLQPLACMMKSLPESKTFSFLPTSLACHLPWWLQRLAPSMCYCLDVVALHHHMPSWLCRVQLGLVSKTHLLTRSAIWNVLGVTLAHLGGNEGHFAPIPYTLWRLSGYSRGKVLSSVSQDVRQL